MLEQYSRVYARIDLDAVEFNMNSMHENIGKDTRMVGVIKTDAYGHGAVQIGRVLEALPYVYGYAVATVEEAMELRDAGILKPVIILGHTFEYAYPTIVEQDFRPATFQLSSAMKLSEAARAAGKNVKVHIAVDTGMGRIGVMPDEEGLSTVLQIAALPHIEIEGIFTHFARADEADKQYANRQTELYTAFVKQVEQELGYRIPLKHISNSAGIVELPEVNFDLVRAGITMYGLWPSDEVSRKILNLRPVMQLKSHVAYVKKVPAGTAISYGGTYVTEHEEVIATIPVGYGDGYPRGLSNCGEVLIRGKRAPIRGRVCMDQCMVDVSDIPNVAEGDEVTLLGTDGTQQITMEDLGALSGRFNYEIACLINQRVPRVYIREGKEI